MRVNRQRCGAVVDGYWAMPNSVVELRWIDPERDAVWLAPLHSTTGQHQSAVDCSGCAKMPQAQRADLRFCRQPSQLDLTNAQYDGVEIR